MSTGEGVNELIKKLNDCILSLDNLKDNAINQLYDAKAQNQQAIFNIINQPDITLLDNNSFKIFHDKQYISLFDATLKKGTEITILYDAKNNKFFGSRKKENAPTYDSISDELLKQVIFQNDNFEKAMYVLDTPNLMLDKAVELLERDFNSAKNQFKQFSHKNK